MTQLNTISNEEELERQLSEPTQRVIDTLSRLSGDLLILGAGGKMGPSLARMAKRALESAGSRSKVIAVARFSNETLRERLEAQGIETLACDLTDAQQLARLPDATHIVYMMGMKFGSTARPADTWATNCLAPYL
ncbi:MAG TPA: NAD-dependent epimerase/dehydratase family protein, partial [Burkholderiaceae bacterium]|nr:NAD-dependent epimerase/dehydratase family protein [Burkholderiaceae bacterium]